jgi:hypothetical protein
MNDPIQKRGMKTLTAVGEQMVNRPATGALEDRSADILGVAFGGIGGRMVMKAAKTATKKALDQFMYTDNTMSGMNKMNAVGKVYTPKKAPVGRNVRKQAGPPMSQAEITKKIAKRAAMDYSEVQAKATVGNAAQMGIEKALERFR